MPYLLRDASGREYPILAVTKIGRDLTNTIILDDPPISRLHATLWEQQGVLYVRDEKSRNGTLVNGQRIQQAVLHPGDQLRLGKTTLVVVQVAAQPPAYPPPGTPHPPRAAVRPARRSSRTLIIALLGGGALLLCLLVLGFVFASYILPSAKPTPSLKGAIPSAPGSPENTPEPPKPGITILGTVEPAALLKPQEFAASNETLAKTIADLNQAELGFIKASKTTTWLMPGFQLFNLAHLAAPVPPDDLLREIAAQAMKTAQTASALERTAANPGGGSETALQVADKYTSIARLCYAQVIEVQNLREGLKDGTVKPADAVDIVAAYGARLWNPAVTDPAVKGNPFLPSVKDASTFSPVQFLNSAAIAQLKTQAGAKSKMQAWLATTQETVTKTITLPAPLNLLPNPLDPGLLEILTSAGGQADVDRARQVAAASLKRILPPTGSPGSGLLRQVASTGLEWLSQPSALSVVQHKSGNLQITIPSGTAIAGQKQVAAGKLPSYPKGSASALSDQSAGGGDPEALVQTLYHLNGQAAPTISDNTPLKESPPAFVLNITTIKETSRVKNDQGYTGIGFDVWVGWRINTGLINPKFTIGCLGGTATTVTTLSGNIKLTAFAYASGIPGKAEIQCRLSSYSDFGSTLQSVTSEVWVNEAESADNTPTPTPTQTETPTPTETPTQTVTPTSNKTVQAQETEDAKQKTAEFQATITSIAATTEKASTAGVFTMNGTFGMGKGDGNCSPGVHTSGTLVITANYPANSASGTLVGGGGGTKTGLVCDNMTYEMVWHQSYTGSFSGGLDTNTGAVSMSGTVTFEESYMYQNCKENGEDVTCSQPGKGSPSGPVTLSGIILKDSRTGKGTIKFCEVCTGDWSAAQ